MQPVYSEISNMTSLWSSDISQRNELYRFRLENIKMHENIKVNYKYLKSELKITVKPLESKQ